MRVTFVEKEPTVYVEAGPKTADELRGILDAMPKRRLAILELSEHELGELALALRDLALTRKGRRHVVFAASLVRAIESAQNDLLDPRDA